MKNSLSTVALSVTLAYAIAFPAEADPSGPAVLSKPATHAYARNLYFECLGAQLYLSLKHGFVMDNFFSELDGIMSACKLG